MTHKVKIEFREANRKDFRLIKKIIRKEDMEELKASSGKRFEDVIDETRDVTDFAIAGYADGKLIALFGIRTITSVTKTGAIWMFGSKFLPKYSLTFLRNCKKCVKVMTEDYPLVFNFVDSRNKMIINWLKWIGFIFEESRPHGPQKIPFCKFYMKK